MVIQRLKVYTKSEKIPEICRIIDFSEYQILLQLLVQLLLLLLLLVLMIIIITMIIIIIPEYYEEKDIKTLTKYLAVSTHMKCK